MSYFLSSELYFVKKEKLESIKCVKLYQEREILWSGKDCSFKIAFLHSDSNVALLMCRM